MMSLVPVSIYIIHFSTVFANVTKRMLVVLARAVLRPKKVWEKTETCMGLADYKVLPYYIEAHLLRSPRFVTLAAL